MKRQMSVDTAPNECFHCGLPVTTGDRFTMEYEGEQHRFCCPGCRAVAQSIVASGMDNYYQYRTSPAITPQFEGETLSPLLLQELQVYDDAQLQQEFAHELEGDVREAVLSIEGITCAACVWLLEHALANVDGVEDVSVNLSTHRAVVSWHSSALPLSELLKSIYCVGYKAYPFSPTKEEAYQQQEARIAMRRLLLAGIGMMQVMMFTVPLYVGELSGIAEQHKALFRWSGLLLTTPVVLYSAIPFFQAAWRDLHARYLTMDIPVSLAIGIAYLASVWSTLTAGREVYFDSVCMFAFFLLLGRFLEMRVRHRVSDLGNRLLKLLPTSAIRLEGDKQQIVASKLLKKGDLILIKPGATVPADALVREGESGVDEAALSGESMPVHKAPGSKLVGGTLNIENPLTAEVTDVGKNMQISTIVQLLERAKQEKPAITQLANRLSSYFVFAVLLIAALVALYWGIVHPADAFWVTLSVLVVTCPCALSLATPAALTAATASLSAKKILLIRGHILETLPHITHVIFDKTGTLTQGALNVEDTKKLGSYSVQKCRELAAALERYSEHPIAAAFEKYAELAESIAVTQVDVCAGQGIEGVIEGCRYRIGTVAYVCQLGSAQPELPDEDGQWILLGDEHASLCWFRLGDELRRDAKSCVESLKKRGLQLELLSGDPSSSAVELGHRLGVNKVTSGASPQDKLDYIRGLQEGGAFVVMVGDGINDGPVLARSQVSIAVGCASDLARANADVLLPSAELAQIPLLFEKARQTQNVIKQNLAWALMYNLMALPLAIAGMVAPYAAALGMSASSLVVVGNALRLKGALNKDKPEGGK